MVDIFVNTEVLRDAAGDLDRVRLEFEAATTNSENVADATGHDGLAGRVRAFASNWDHRRVELIEEMTTLQENLVSVADALEAADDDLGAWARDLTPPPQIATPLP